MSFLSVAFLAALPLAAVPILLHLFDRRRNVVIEWGAMQFLMEAAARRTSARRLKQWLLLLLRVLAVTCLVLALARPMARGDWFGNRDRSETIFVVDNSMSMMRTGDDLSLFDSATLKSSEMLEDIGPGNFVRVLLASPYPVWATPATVRFDDGSRRVVDEQLQELRPTHGSSDLLAALFAAVQAEREPTAKRRRIVLLTDGQKSDWNTGDEAGWQRFREALQAAAVPTQLEVVNLESAPSATGNLAVNRIHSSRTVVGVHQPFTLTAKVQNHGSAPAAELSVAWTVGGEEQQQDQIPALEAGAVHEVVWKHSFSTVGVYALSCQIASDDVLTADNRETVIVEVVDQVPVLVVESAPDQAEFQRDAFFVQAALGAVDEDRLDPQGVYVPTLAAPEELNRIGLQKYRAVVIPNLTDLGEVAIRRLQNYVFDGGGLWIALGPRTDVEHFNHSFFAEANGLAPQAIDRLVDEPASGAQKTMINPFGKGHPATAALADNQRLDTGEIVVSRRFRFVPLPPGQDVSVLLSLTNGEPLAVEKYVGQGRVIVQSIPLRLQWSELARSQAFVVMVQDWLSYLTQPQATRHNLAPGDPIELHLAGDSREATLRTPQEDEIELTADASSDGVVFRSSRTILPGDYSLEVGLSGDQIPFHVHRDPRESNLTPLTAADHAPLAEVMGLSRNAASEQFPDLKPTDPLWPLLWMLLLGLMAAELMLSGMIARQRFGTDPIAETAEQVADHPTALPMVFLKKSHSSADKQPTLSNSRS